MTASRTFPAVAASTAAARGWLRAGLAHLPVEILDAAELMLSELATNAVRHATSSFTVTVDERPAALRVAVQDAEARLPALRSPAALDPSGRGLRIVDEFADRWGVARDGDGKTVWFEVGLAPATELPDAGRAVAPGPHAAGAGGAGDPGGPVDRPRRPRGGAPRRRAPRDASAHGPRGHAARMP